MSKRISCPNCNSKMKTWGYSGSNHYRCESCGNIYLLDYEGNLVQMFYSEKKEKTCESCGMSLKHGEFTGAWENGNNPNSYVTCPYCRHINFLD